MTHGKRPIFTVNTGRVKPYYGRLDDLDEGLFEFELILDHRRNSKGDM